MMKRKRGRPRRDDSTSAGISNFDLSLVQEFKKRREFYDRSHTKYRNRDIVEPLWVDLAKSVGCNVALVKERIVQLRNRYNLEKRRIETLQEQYPNQNISSTWHMYEHLTFLGEHIKSRTPGKLSNNTVLPKMVITPKLQPRIHMTGNEQDTDESSSEINQPPLEPIIQYEAQNGIDGNDSNETPSDIDTDTYPTEQKSPPQQDLQINHNPFRPSKSADIKQNQLNGLHEPLVNTTNPLEYISSNQMQINQDKFHSFGQFITSSLIDMSEENALFLVEKFTIDVVQLLQSEIQSASEENSSANHSN